MSKVISPLPGSMRRDSSKHEFPSSFSSFFWRREHSLITSPGISYHLRRNWVAVIQKVSVTKLFFWYRWFFFSFTAYLIHLCKLSMKFLTWKKKNTASLCFSKIILTTLEHQNCCQNWQKLTYHSCPLKIKFQQTVVWKNLAVKFLKLLHFDVAVLFFFFLMNAAC